ncbi:MAG: hypothetical protein VX589_17795 [Myxococcota bacterium]|nr:hypothetical protein [Myxococcota bacterium]
MTADSIEGLFAQASREITVSRDGWAKRNAGLARVAARRAAGMAIRATLLVEPVAAAGSNFMHHLSYLADATTVPLAVRESAWRLANRPAPGDGFQASDPMPTQPAQDAESILAWAQSSVRVVSDAT